MAAALEKAGVDERNVAAAQASGYYAFPETSGKNLTTELVQPTAESVEASTGV